jgi:hypothetical protein
MGNSPSNEFDGLCLTKCDLVTLTRNVIVVTVLGRTHLERLLFSVVAKSLVPYRQCSGAEIPMGRCIRCGYGDLR